MGTDIVQTISLVYKMIRYVVVGGELETFEKKRDRHRKKKM